MRTYSKDVCRGQYSIQKEINSLARASGADWPKKIKSEQWREAVRQKLRASTSEWCDYKEKICCCDR